MQIILKVTLGDDDMKLMTRFITHGFPANNADVSGELKQYFKYQQELSTQNGLNFKSNRESYEETYYRDCTIRTVELKTALSWLEIVGHSKTAKRGSYNMSSMPIKCANASAEATNVVM